MQYVAGPVGLVMESRGDSSVTIGNHKGSPDTPFLYNLIFLGGEGSIFLAFGGENCPVKLLTHPMVPMMKTVKKWCGSKIYELIDI